MMFTSPVQSSPVQSSSEVGFQYLSPALVLVVASRRQDPQRKGARDGEGDCRPKRVEAASGKMELTEADAADTARRARNATKVCGGRRQSVKQHEPIESDRVCEQHRVQ